ncbi:uncharacterized protein LOC110820824 [Carica papaya]|uniref:uncharacterized protein LOC110820824 n=1 Tax=Carica papaya TaxID=3649 RepID=UPI000B8CF049|nr:uncharacterized protein LOC110820824 [Carica papaya]
MKSISRSPAKRHDGFYKFLKPGALARLRDSRIIARSSKTNCLPTCSSPHRIDLPLPQMAAQVQTQIQTFDQIPDFLNKIYSPYCIRRKRLAAAKSVSLLSLSTSNPVLESGAGNSNHPLVSVVNSDVVVAH